MSSMDLSISVSQQTANLNTRIEPSTKVNNLAPAQNVDKKVENTKSDVDSKFTSEKKTEEFKVSQEDIVAISEDGDTLQASKAGINASTSSGALVIASEDGAVSQIENDSKPVDDSKNKNESKTVNVEETQSKSAEIIAEQIEEVKESAEERKANNTSEVNSLAGYTKQQVEMMYLQGKISRYDYDVNMRQREEMAEDSQESSSETREEVIRSQISAQEAFAKSMGQISAQAQKVANMDQGIIDAYNNDRLDIVGDIFTKPVN